MIKVHFTYSNNLFSKLTRLFTVSQFSHIEIEVDGMCYSAKPFVGVYKQTAEELKTDKNIVIESFILKHKPTEAQKELILNFLNLQVGKKYDYKAVIACGLFKRDWENNLDKWFCSELVAKSLELAGLRLINKYYKPNRVIPEDLVLSLRLVKIGA